MKIELVKDINSVDPKDFNKFLEVNDHGNFFQSIKAFQFFTSVDNYTPVLISAAEEKEIVGSLLAVIIREKSLIKGYLSRRCIVYGGPIVKNNDQQITNNILKYFDKIISNKVIYSEFRALFDMNDYKKLFEKNGYSFDSQLNYIINIASFESNRKLLHSSRRRQINLSYKNGAEIAEPGSLDEIKSFYKILLDLYKNKVKKPLPGLKFFEEFYLNENLGKFFLIKYDNKIIGGIMCPVFKDKIFEWYVCGLDNQYKNIYPSVLATWAPIEYGIVNGLKYFDFLGAGKPNEDYGVREFKSKFGGQLVNYGRFTKICNKTLYNIGKTGLKIISKVK